MWKYSVGGRSARAARRNGAEKTSPRFRIVNRSVGERLGQAWRMPARPRACDDASVDSAFGMQLRLVARPGRTEELVDALAAVDASLREEAACLVHLLGTAPGQERAVIVSEAWTDREAHARWRAAPETAPLIARVRAAAEGPPEVVEVAWRGGKGLSET